MVVICTERFAIKDVERPVREGYLQRALFDGEVGERSGALTWHT